MYINGQWETTDKEKMFDIFNPANGEKIGQVPNGNGSDAKRAIIAADKAFEHWSKTTPHQRSDYLYRAWEIMLERKEQIARVMTQEQGKPLKSARNEVQYGADFLLWYAEEAKRVSGEILPSARADQRFLVLHQPVGVVAAVTPWNYPVSMITRKIAPAVAAGCTIVLKPAEATPLCAIEMFKVFEAARFPVGVVNLVTALDPSEIGEEFTSNPIVRKLTFTGSTAVGKMLASKAAANMKRLSLELGGHAPFIVFDDADPAHAAKGGGLVKFLNTGQACISPNRFLVQNSTHDSFVATLKSRIANMKAGNGFDDGITIGPLVNQGAIDKMNRQIDDAVNKGADVIIGGEQLTTGDLSKGFFFAPTILTNVTPEMLIWREETFGPIAPILRFDTEAQALSLANDTDYGLAAYVYTHDFSRAMRLFESLNFGIIGINDINPTSAGAPFGGIKQSGLGREGAKDGIFEYLETKLGGFSI